MKVLVLSNNEFTTKKITNELKDLQEIVGGYIEIPYLSKIFNDNGIDVIINEEGKLIQGMKPEIAIVEKKSGRILDVVYGNCIFASHDEEGNTTELNDEQTTTVMNELETVIEMMNKNTFEEFNVRVLFI